MCSLCMKVPHDVVPPQQGLHGNLMSRTCTFTMHCCIDTLSTHYLHPVAPSQHMPSIPVVLSCCNPLVAELSLLRLLLGRATTTLLVASCFLLCNDCRHDLSSSCVTVTSSLSVCACCTCWSCSNSLRRWLAEQCKCL